MKLEQLNGIAEMVQQLWQEVHKLRNQPPKSFTLFTEQLTSLVETIMVNSASEVSVRAPPATNLVTRAPYGQHLVKPGAFNVKDAKLSSPFNGHHNNIHPFLKRVENWSDMLPERYKFTWTWIQATNHLVIILVFSWMMCLQIQNILNQSKDSKAATQNMAIEHITLGHHLYPWGCVIRVPFQHHQAWGSCTNQW